MKLIVLGSITVLIIVVTSSFWYQSFILPSKDVVSSSPQPTIKASSNPTPTPNLTEIVFNNHTYRYGSLSVASLSKLELYLNLPQKLTTRQLLDTYRCQSLVNAGFYDSQDQPLGWMVTSLDSGTNQDRPNDLFNGYLWVSNQQLVSITKTIPSHQPRIGVQSGPVLIYTSKSELLSIKNDLPKRRVVALVTSDKRLLFIIIAGSESLLTGPRLGDLPQLVLAISHQLGHQVDSAINLDGGTASAFITSEISIEEINPIGSFFCLH